jgi:hypothetical protein
MSAIAPRGEHARSWFKQVDANHDLEEAGDQIEPFGVRKTRGDDGHEEVWVQQM